MPSFRQPPQTIEQLRKRYEELHRKRITADADHKNAQLRLDELKASARQSYGTDDLSALRDRLTQMEADNARKVAEYQAHLDKIESDLREVEQKFQQPPVTR